jgi:pimeloyl-ACP methyl ester carboxylesterase
MTLHILGTIGAGADSGGGAFGPKSVQVLPTSRADIAVRQSAGPGMSVLLLHAPASSKDAFDALFQKELASDYRMIAIDLPGHGASGEAHDPASAYTTEGYADCALETLERLGVERAFVVDASQDGWIGRELATIFPGLLGLAVLGPSNADYVDDDDRGAPPVFQLPEFSEASLKPVLKRMERRETALTLSPLLWYGG